MHELISVVSPTVEMFVFYNYILHCYFSSLLSGFTLKHSEKKFNVVVKF